MADIIDDSECFCIVCIHVLDNFVKLKQSVMTIILNPEATFTAITPGLGPFWHFVAQNIKKKDPDVDYYNPSPPVTNVTTTASPSTSFSQENSSSRGPTPLLLVTNVKTYNETLERFVENRERIRSESRRERDLQSEIVGKKRGRPKENRSDSTIRKMRDDIISSLSEHSSRPVSTTSEMSIVSYKGDSDRRSKSRSVSRGSRKPGSQFADFSALEVSRKKEIEESGFVCTLSECKNSGRESFTISNYNKHMREVHNRMCLYRCVVCGNEYFTKEQLDEHTSEKHDVSPILCRLCLKMQENSRSFQAHLDEHRRYQKCCSLCDLSFLTKKDLNHHIYLSHRRKGVDSKRIFTESRQQIGIKRVIIHKPEVPNRCLPVTNNDRYSYRKINIQRNSRGPEEFRPRNFKELFHIQKERRNKRTVNGLRYVGARNRKIFPLGDSVYYNESLDDTIQRSEACFPSPYTCPTEDEYRPSSRTVAPYDRFHFAYDDDVRFVDYDDEVEEINRYHSGRSEFGRSESGRSSRYGMCDSRTSQYSSSQESAVQKFETDSEEENRELHELNNHEDDDSLDSEPHYYGDCPPPEEQQQQNDSDAS
ncbi:uncharacterized protein LOC126749723 [Anthonomus grandis grandis]|uniref:uncharacterized protein LOC126749723 n=1 Tax=Anthonomus grandis grandis TaxID=2921223 RepID=UPI002166B113|nr:uncharacterized protein LOC126749723 [Anthonomus grandis grandis]